MYKLICVSGMNKGQEYELPGECEVSMGRSKENSICVFDKKSSRFHCKLFVNGDKIVLEDLNSTNGLMINDNLVKGKVDVKIGDAIGIGQTIFMFVSESTSGQNIMSNQPVADEADQKKYENLINKTSFQVTKTTALRKMKAEQMGKETGFLSFFKTKKQD